MCVCVYIYIETFSIKYTLDYFHHTGISVVSILSVDVPVSLTGNCFKIPEMCIYIFKCVVKREAEFDYVLILDVIEVFFYYFFYL